LAALLPGFSSLACWSRRIQAVSTENPFESRKSLPENWRGLEGQELCQVSAIAGCVFVRMSSPRVVYLTFAVSEPLSLLADPTGFIGGNETFGGALAMATAALSQE
jgi:uncharacterized UPF0160 family protein